MNPSKDIERKSSAVTLSDMEMFIFPELIYSLVLANIMSPRIWAWREDPWFDGIERAKPYRRITRLKQYIMEHYMFNLDLDTWGLTTKERELARFRDFVGEDALGMSNALFGYEGDKYYFDIDIRRHFGLDSYTSNVIPYWKTETVEAMDAFAFRPDYKIGAGECVSLSTLYAAALFVVARIPLEDIYLMATPLHSQNFIDVDDGILTNNRRLVTKNMWFNGTPLSAQARRALENERVTITAHATGCIHTIYDDATIDRDRYAHFSNRLRSFLTAPLDSELLCNFLRHHSDLQKCFQFRWSRHGSDHFGAMERVFKYEHGSPYRVSDKTREKLLNEMDSEEMMHDPLPGRIVLNDLEQFVKNQKLDLGKAEDAQALKVQFGHDCLNAEEAVENLVRFTHVEPRLPSADTKTYSAAQSPLGIDLDMSREEIVQRLEDIREGNEMAGLSFYAYRDLARTEPEPFLKAAVQRNPVAGAGAAGLDEEQVVARLVEMPDPSIYDGPARLAQPDEVWNYGRGDGLEKAVLLANVLRLRRPDDDIMIDVAPEQAVVRAPGREVAFASAKALQEQSWTVPAGPEM